MYTYIIIDDEELIRKGTIKKIYTTCDNVTCIGEADNGISGIKMIRDFHPDFVILDMQMPEMDGMELLPYLSEHFSEIPLIVISGYRNFDYIKQAFSAKAVEYLLKPFSREMIRDCVLQVIDRFEKRTELNTQILTAEKEQANYDYDIQLLYNLILGYHVNSTMLTSKKLNFINDTHNLLLLSLHFTVSDPGGVVRSWLSEHGFGDLALYISGAETANLGFIILFLPHEGSLPDRQLARQILNALLPWMEEQQMSGIAGISNTHSGLAELNTAYTETSHALDYQTLKNGSTNCYFYNGDAEPHQIIWDKTDEFLFRIEAGMDNEVINLTKDLFTYYKTIEGCTLADVKYHCYQLSNQCRIILNEYLNANTPAVSSSMQNVISHIFTIEDLEKYYTQFFLNITNMIRPQSIYAIDDVIEKIKIYMQRNIQKNLTQEFISSLFFINRSYLSTLFKERTGKKFVNYLNELRIQSAQQQLIHTNRKMYQIARSTGYENVKYFFRVFKKHTGLTPEQYRRQNDKQ